MSAYQPPFTLAGEIVSRVAEIGELLGRFEERLDRLSARGAELAAGFRGDPGVPRVQ